MHGPSSAETWDAFFSDFYLRAYAADEDDDEAEAQALGAARLAGCRAGGELLDVPCGFGRHSSRSGAPAIASPASTARPRCSTRRAAAPGTSAGRSSCSADYRELPFAGRELRRRRSTCSARSATSATRRTPRARRDRPRAAPGRAAGDRD